MIEYPELTPLDNKLDFTIFNIFDPNMRMILPEKYSLHIEGTNPVNILTSIMTHIICIHKIEHILIYPLFNDNSLNTEDNLYIIRWACIFSIITLIDALNKTDYINRLDIQDVLDIQCEYLTVSDPKIIYPNPNQIKSIYITIDSMEEPLVIELDDISEKNAMVLRLYLNIGGFPQVVYM